MSEWPSHEEILGWLNSGDVEKFDALLASGFDIDHEENGSTLLGLSLYEDPLSIVELLLQRGANPNWVERSAHAWGPMYTAAAMPERPEILRLLIRYGGCADKCISEEDVDTPLHSPAQAGHVEILKLLIESGAEVCLSTFHYALEWTPLIAAVKGGSCEAVQLLLEAGSDVNAHCEARIGETALGQAIWDECSFEMAKLLIDAGANPLIKGWMWNTAYSRAMERKDEEGRRIFSIVAEAAERCLLTGIDELKELDEVVVTKEVPGLGRDQLAYFHRRLPDGWLRLHLARMTNYEFIDVAPADIRLLGPDDLPHRKKS